jgi:hypothetical protein
MFFGGFSADPHHQDHSAVIGRILDSGRLVAIFSGLEPAELCHLAHFPDWLSYSRDLNLLDHGIWRIL